MDKRRNNKGTAGNKGGRPSKAEELKLIEKLTPMEDEALKQLKKGVASGDYKFIALYMSYLYDKPKESKDITSNGETIKSIDPISWVDDGRDNQ